MFGVHNLGLFVISAFLLNVTPGPDTLYIVGRSAAQGLRAGVLAALGIGAGALVHVSAAALGLSALLAASTTAFIAVKLIGAAYLLYVGVGLIRSAAEPAHPAASESRELSMRSVFLQGFLTNVTNPKVALFFLAFLPQFVATDASSKPLAFLLLGIIFDCNGTLWNLFLAWSAARLTRLAPRAAFKTWCNRCIGGIFIAIGIRLALAHN